MKAMILAAGLGTRMRPLTLQTPKPLLPIGGKSLIVWHIEALKKAGIEEIVINCAWLADKMMTALGDGSQFGVKIYWSREDEALETAGGIIQALPLLGDEPFILINGDIWTRFDVQNLTKISLGNDLAHLVLVENPPQHPNGDFVLQQGRVWSDFNAHCEAKTAEKLTFSGLSVLSPQLFANLTTGKRALAPLLRDAMQQGRASGVKMDSAWVDVGTPERLGQLDEQITTQKI